MAIDITVDELIELNYVPKLLQKHLGKRLNLAMLYRWHARGIAGVRLETLLVGGKRFTTVDALNRFFAESTLAKQGRPSVVTEKRNGRANFAREKELEREAKRLGI